MRAVFSGSPVKFDQTPVHFGVGLLGGLLVRLGELLLEGVFAFYGDFGGRARYLGYFGGIAVAQIGQRGVFATASVHGTARIRVKHNAFEGVT